MLACVYCWSMSVALSILEVPLLTDRLRLPLIESLRS